MDSNLTKVARVEAVALMVRILQLILKVCPQCNSQAVCKCGYAFPSKSKAQSGNAMKRRRVHKASVRASETSQKNLCRQEMDRVRRAGKRASSETPDQ